MVEEASAEEAGELWEEVWNEVWERPDDERNQESQR